MQQLIIFNMIYSFEGLIISLIESPCFFTFLDFAYMPSKLFENKPHWIKATLYLWFVFIYDLSRIIIRNLTKLNLSE